METLERVYCGDTEQEKTAQALRRGIAAEQCNVDELLWAAILAWQQQMFYTASGLRFSYTVKRNRTGAYSGELLISRKEGSKTLTRSSVLLAFHIILDAWYSGDSNDSERADEMGTPPLYKGPKAIGQIFGISYLYSIFWKLGLIQVPAKVAEKMHGPNTDRGFAWDEDSQREQFLGNKSFGNKSFGNKSFGNIETP